ncbi:MAG: hypothetical protein FWC53_00190 [Firmicutes bacterium]|nr:hypothetical protein [Bacillota bacterium]
MLKTKLKTFSCVMLALICLLSPLSFATDAAAATPEGAAADTNTAGAAATDANTANANDTAASTTGTAPTNQLNSDIYVQKPGSYTFDSNVFGNVYAAAKDITIDPKNDMNNGIIQGNLFAVANTVTLKSNIVYSTTTKDDQGNANPESASGLSKIAGNAFITANKVVIESGCIISGDLYITANDVEIQPYSQIYGNIYIVANKLAFNGAGNLNLYAAVNDFEMTSYLSFVGVNAHIVANKTVLNGMVGNNSFIKSNKLYTGEFFVSYGAFNAEAKSSVLLGNFKGDANVNTKNLSVVANKDEINNNKNALKNTPLSYLLNTDNLKDFKTTFEKNLKYTAKSEINFADGVLSKDDNGNAKVQYSKYSMTRSIVLVLIAAIIALLAILIYVMLIYFLSKKFKYDCFENLNLYNVKRALISLGIGVILAIAVPLVCLLLAVIIVGIPVAGLLAAIYGIMLALAIPAVIIQSASFLNEKLLKGKLNSYVALLCATVIFWLLALIPYVGCVLVVLALLTGSGHLELAMCSKKECSKKE